MMKTYTIGQISKIVDLPTKTIRFYEESGIISKAKRANNGYRLYPETAIDELALIKNARDLGLPLSEIKKLMKGCETETCNHTMQQVGESIDDYMKLLENKIKQFTTLKMKLEKLKNNLCMGNDTCEKNKYCCNILRQLAETT